MTAARKPRGIPLAILSAAGIALFLWPFTGAGSIPAAPALAVVAGLVTALLLVEAGTRRLDSRALALLAAMAAMDAGLRLVLVVGVGGFSPIFFLILCAGYMFGASFGFLLGAIALLVSALITGGLGPWLPYQVFAAGWVGLLAGLAGLRRRSPPGRMDILILAVIGIAAGFAFGILMDAWEWSFFRGSPDLGWTPGMDAGASLARFVRFYLVTSLAYDSFRALGNALLVISLGAPVLAALGRFSSRFSLVVAN